MSDQQHTTKPYGSRRTHRGPAPAYGAALELRNLLPGLTAKVTGTRPCVRCGGATPSAKRKLCANCK